MALTKDGYIPRLVDPLIEKSLKIFGAVSIEGPKWCGKTWSSLNQANSATYMTDKSSRDLANVDPKYIFQDKRPQLIDEWQIVPEIWDTVRHECDSDRNKGKFILTGSTSLGTDGKDKRVFHSGTGRITTIRMHPMSLFESNDSDERASISSMKEGKLKGGYVRKVELSELAKYIVRGGWPENIGVPDDDIGILPASYIESVVKNDMHERKDRKRDSNKMRMLIRSLARNESTIAGDATLVRDIADYENEKQLIESRQTVSDYMNVLNDLYMTANQEAFAVNYRSSKRVGKSPKRHLVDPSLTCAALNLSVEKLLHDHETFGLLFEALVERDLRIYAESMGAKLYHFRDNTSGDEVDAVIEFVDGEYAAFEIKLSDGSIDEAKESLARFYDNVQVKPKFMCIIVGHCEAVMIDEEKGIYITPFTSIAP